MRIFVIKKENKFVKYINNSYTNEYHINLRIKDILVDFCYFFNPTVYENTNPLNRNKMNNR